MALQRTHYNTLKVASDAPVEVVRAAYRVLAQKYHPDRNPGDGVAATEMVLVNEAYRVLSHADLRKQYDLKLQTQTVEETPSKAHPTKSPTREPERHPNAKPQNPHSGQNRGKSSVDLEQVWESWFGRSGTNQSASEAIHNPRKSDCGGLGRSEEFDSVDLNTVSDGFAALFGRRRKK